MCVLGRRGVFTGVSGLQIAYVSGREALQEPAPAHCFTSKDLSALVTPLTNSSKFRGVDILLTSQWPRGVWQYGNNPVTRKSRIYKYYCYWQISGQFLIQHGREADEDCVIWSKAPEQLLNGSCSEIVLSAAVSEANNQLSAVVFSCVCCRKWTQSSVEAARSPTSQTSWNHDTTSQH